MNLRHTLVNKLGAEKDPKNPVICKPSGGLTNCRYQYPKSDEVGLEVSTPLEKSKAKSLDKNLKSRLCDAAKEKNFTVLLSELEQENIQLANIYLDINCSMGETPMHIVLRDPLFTKQEKSLSSKMQRLTILRQAHHLVTELVKAKETNPALDTAKFFNMKVNYQSEDRTVLDMFDLNMDKMGVNIENPSAESPDAGWATIRRVLVEKLGAEVEPEKTIICEPTISSNNCRY